MKSTEPKLTCKAAAQWEPEQTQPRSGDVTVAAVAVTGT
jgi:hypothetical protein